jgi:hypothetical protein
MIEEIETIVVQKTELNTLEDCISLLSWAQAQEGLAVTISAQADGNIQVQAEGVTVPTVYATLGDTVRWDGTRFTVTQPEPEPEP